MKDLKGCFLAALIYASLYAVSWGLCIGLFYLVCLCFGWAFKLSVATGIWVILCILKHCFGEKERKG